jgi:ADP-ribosyl-[dinitrogen reductase] hydrolase
MSTKALEDIVDAAASRDTDPSIADRYRAVLLGVATGNALGLAVEGLSQAAIHRHWPDGIRDVQPFERERPWDDDLAQTYVLATSLLCTEELNTNLFAQELVRWRGENGRGIGHLTRDVIQELVSGTPTSEAARLVWERSGWSNAGNGAVMRCSPVALRYRLSGAALVRNARASALVTHFDARCEWSTVVVAVALAAALSDAPAPVDELAAATDGLGDREVEPAAREQVVDAIRATDGVDLESLELDDAMDMGYTLKAMQVVLWCLQQRDGFEPVVTRVVNAGGDTDTNGAVAGAAMGGRGSTAAIPRRWIEHVASTDELVAVADRLFAASQRRP